MHNNVMLQTLIQTLHQNAFIVRIPYETAPTTLALKN